jgi:hypothetical protein
MAIILIIRRFFFVVLSLTKYSYSKYKSVQIIVGITSRPSYSVIIFSVELIANVISIPAIILYILEASIFLVTLLFLVEF